MSYNTILATAPLTTQNFVLKATGTTIGNSLIWDNGTNVGIGNTNTSYTLDVSGTGRFTGNLLTSGYALIGTTSSTGVGASRLQITGATAQLLVSNTTSSGHIALYTTGVDAYITKNTASGIMYFGLAPQDGSSFTSQMAITSAGNVGIGTSNPTGKLDVASRGITTGSMPVGSVIQTVSYTMTGGFSTSSASDQDTGLKLSITPTSSTSKILVIITINGRVTAGGGNCYINCKLVKGAFDTGTTLYNGYAILGSFNASDLRGTINISYLDSPATTSSTQYVISMNSQFGSAVYVNSTTTPSTITLMEIAQ